MTDSPDIQGDLPEAEPTAAELEAAGQSALFGAPEPAEIPAAIPAAMPLPAASPAPSPNQPYRVLARKYRPQTFAELIGQDAMVQTLGNAIKRDRLAHAFLMTGVRGVGKTTTARLIAKALNCIGPDGQGGPTINPCGVCEPCVAIAEGRHIDVIEMDAASHTGVDDVREIIEAVRYATVTARYKIYIIDEVHMLSKNAFNALLKTLEEPPAHVKFLFATTEVNKLPITVLSRCQRFDLRRITPEMLAGHFAMVCKAEGVAAEDEALAMIAAAAEGSVRDGLSILDQAIAHADMDGAGVSAEAVRQMLGLADRRMGRDLFAALLAGDAAAMLAQVAAFHSLGVEPQALLRGQMALVHEITLAQVSGGSSDAALADWAQRLSAGQLHRLWQLLLRGHDEVRQAPEPPLAAQMALLRVLHIADQPDPGELLRLIENGVVLQSDGARSSNNSSQVASVDTHEVSQLWPDLIRRVENCSQPGCLSLSQTMHDWMRVVEIGPAVLRFKLVPGLNDDPSRPLADMLLKVTGERWRVECLAADDPAVAQPALRELAEAADHAARDAILNAPMVQAALAAFPGAELIETGDEPAPNWSKRA